MYLMPKYTKFTKSYGRSSCCTNYNSLAPALNYSNSCLASNKLSLMVFQQINASLKLLKRTLKIKAKVWSSFSANLPITRKPIETRMGKGKGSIKCWACVVQKNQVVFELFGFRQATILKAFRTPKRKLPFQSSLLSKH